MKKFIYMIAVLLAFSSIGATLAVASPDYKSMGFSHKLSDDEDEIDILTSEDTVSLSTKGYAKAFLRKATQLLLENHDEFENGVFFVNKNDASDKYGNKTQLNTIIVYLSPETLNKISFDNEEWGRDPKDLYSIADIARIDSSLETDEFKSVIAGEDEAPVAYYLLIAEGY